VGNNVLGNFLNKFAHTLTVMDSVKLQAVASRNKEKAEAFGKVYEVDTEKCYKSYEDLIEDKSIDAVYITVPHVLHKKKLFPV
jgi:dihydrodiol dehydrogenase / D-xylose 1-dehydrogenase (NADP)